ncbi:Ethanolamine utilization protein EutN [Tepidimonas alkaliphilus]|uniref:Ethanolamine utilization protein EutN n=1 Tax=Tepidimonas alkaliphilus TaxID=2588942 RepID=A0A554W662_9BURK|nr:carboxysome peptide B [Tepidimonas alkaliphilus]TSE19077.1 Ethanolamine utilization protein EutN [Tepidimonas alkaliphilus]
MDIVRVVGELVCTRRVPGLGSASLRVVRSAQGVVSVATDPVGAPVGRWVFATTGSAARLAMPDKTCMTDLTICGIIDHWDEDVPAATTEHRATGVGSGASKG